jgi:hypothetical protein
MFRRLILMPAKAVVKNINNCIPDANTRVYLLICTLPFANPALKLIFARFLLGAFAEMGIFSAK